MNNFWRSLGYKLSITNLLLVIKRISHMKHLFIVTWVWRHQSRSINYTLKSIQRARSRASSNPISVHSAAAILDEGGGRNVKVVSATQHQRRFSTPGSWPIRAAVLNHVTSEMPGQWCGTDLGRLWFRMRLASCPPQTTVNALPLPSHSNVYPFTV